MSGGGQTSYNLSPDVAVPGQLGDLNLDSKIRSYPAGEVIEFGRLVEIDASGLAWKVSGTTTSITAASRNLGGFSIFDTAREQALATAGGSSGTAGYKVGEMVPVLRKGTVYACWDGNGSAITPAFGVRPNVNHSSTTDANNLKGTLTANTTSSTAGSEIAQAPAEVVILKDTSGLTPQRGAVSPGAAGPTFVMLVEVNLPGA